MPQSYPQIFYSSLFENNLNFDLLIYESKY